MGSCSSGSAASRCGRIASCGTGGTAGSDAAPACAGRVASWGTGGASGGSLASAAGTIRRGCAVTRSSVVDPVLADDVAAKSAAAVAAPRNGLFMTSPLVCVQVSGAERPCAEGLSGSASSHPTPSALAAPGIAAIPHRERGFKIGATARSPVGHASSRPGASFLPNRCGANEAQFSLWITICCGVRPPDLDSIPTFATGCV